jgi:peptide/nickel transport system ATP-binding protein
MSGGMRQRVMIAMALACRPAVLIADEPTTALDVTIQAQILHLMLDLRREFQMSIVLITHDLGVVAETADRVVVMYAGRKVEEAPVQHLFARPRHPYTVGLLGSVPQIDRTGGPRRARLVEIAGMVPALDRPIVGCRFAPRCPLASERCWTDDPPLEAKAEDHLAACWHSERAREAARV